MIEGGYKYSRPTDDGGAPARVLLVTGISGAGRSTTLRSLDDLGYEAFDNLPLSLVPVVIEGAASELKALFIDCDDERAQRRYTESRRAHPLCWDRPVMDGIRPERRLVFSLRDRADLVIDTSKLTAAQLKRLLTGQSARGSGDIRVFITSFSYRYGIPRDADLIFDVPFLDNPHYLPELRPLTGLHPAVCRDILPRYEKEGKSHLTIGIGCTGGRHRSVYVAERLVEQLRAAGKRTDLSHRDLPPFGAPGPIPLGASMVAS